MCYLDGECCEIKYKAFTASLNTFHGSVDGIKRTGFLLNLRVCEITDAITVHQFLRLKSVKKVSFTPG